MTEQQVFDLIRARLVHARSEHPVFASNALEAVSVIRDELDELEHAVRHESPGRQMDETLDLLATGVRNLMREYEG